MSLVRKQEPERQVEERLLVVFSLGNEEYAAPIFQVREVIKLPAVVKVPESIDFVEGIMNIRGKVIPVLNLKKRLKLGLNESEGQGRVMIVELFSQNAGLIVDTVSEVIRVNEKNIQPSPQMTGKVDNRYIEGVVEHGEKMVILLDLNRIFSEREEEELLLLAEGTQTESLSI